MTLEETNRHFYDESYVKTSERSLSCQNFDQLFENVRNDSENRPNQLRKTEVPQYYDEQDEREYSSKGQASYVDNTDDCHNQDRQKFFIKILIIVLIFACFFAITIFSVQRVLSYKCQNYSVQNDSETIQSQFLNKKQKIGIIPIKQNQLSNKQPQLINQNIQNQINNIKNSDLKEIQNLNIDKNQNQQNQAKLYLSSQILDDASYYDQKNSPQQNKSQILQKENQLRVGESNQNTKNAIIGDKLSQISSQVEVRQKSLAKLPSPNFPIVSNNDNSIHSFENLKPQQRQPSFEPLQIHQSSQLQPQPQQKLNPNLQNSPLNFQYWEAKNPQERISSSMTCSQYISQEQQKYGNLYRFALEHKMLREYSNVKYFSTQDITKITYEKFSEAIDLIELTHHVDQQGNIVAQDNPCYTAQAFKTYMKHLIQSQSERLNNHYQIDSYFNRQLRFCIVVNNYNNAVNGLIYRNIDSILQQNYTNYYVVYTDDNSPQLVGQKVVEYLQQKDIPDQKFKIKINQKKVGMMENIYNAITYDCQDGEIAVMLDGDDSFIGTNVLSMLNAVYQRQKVAMIWNNFLLIEQNYLITLGFSRDIDEYQKLTERFRITNKFVSSHLKSFFVDLFRKINPDDLKYDDTKKFFGGASDTAMMFNMIEMANPRYRYIPQIVYEYRFDTGQVGMVVNRDAQGKALGKIAMQKPYQKLKDFSFIDKAISQALAV